MLRSLTSGIWLTPPEHFIPQPDKTVCITGHRIKSVIPYRNDNTFLELTVTGIQLMLCRYIDLAVEAGYTCFIDGLSTGTDLWAAQYIIRLKNSGTDIKLIGAMPYLRHAERFRPVELGILRNVEMYCDTLTCTNPDPDIVYSKNGAGKELYRTRNYFMADCSSAAIAYYNHSEYRSGTHQTVAYLNNSGKRVAEFSNDDLWRIIDEAGTDIGSVRQRISLLPNPFTQPRRESQH